MNHQTQDQQAKMLRTRKIFILIFFVVVVTVLEHASPKKRTALADSSDILTGSPSKSQNKTFYRI